MRSTASLCAAVWYDNIVAVLIGLAENSICHPIRLDIIMRQSIFAVRRSRPRTYSKGERRRRGRIQPPSTRGPCYVLSKTSDITISINVDNLFRQFAVLFYYLKAE